MPRKKPRNILKRKEVEYDNDPDTVISTRTKRQRKSKNSGNDDDDTPKSFKHFMKYTADLEEKRRGGEGATNKEGGTKKSKANKSKVEQDKDRAVQGLKMMPGETWADFNRRVNEALPLVHKKRTKRLNSAENKSKGGNRNSRKGTEEDDSEDDDEKEEGRKDNRRARSPDPWAHLEQKKNRPKFGEIADRPPDLRLSSRILNNVPKSAGSMARRFILQKEREKVIEGYRTLMEKKKS